MHSVVQESRLQVVFNVKIRWKVTTNMNNGVLIKKYYIHYLPIQVVTRKKSTEMIDLWW